MTIQEIIASLVITIFPLGMLLPEINVKCWENIGWIYSVSTQHIYICDVPGKEMFIEHEIWHHIWFEWLTNEERLQYTKLYNKAITIWDKAFYREYSKQSVLEDFADNFYLARNNIKSNIYIHQRVRFIKKIILRTPK